MIAWTYLGTLLVGLACMVLVDRRWRLVLWADAPRAAAVVGVGMAMFVCWDLAALHLHLYRPGGSAVTTGAEVAPGLPVEELFFIGFLCYLTLVLHRLIGVVSGRRPRRPAPQLTAEEGRR
ncbi:MAG: hypothetical protein QOF53_3092 [Nocardioidaceae bacterium]|jgi:lycopene cyclase domain-containing protein|nr:hypothetical protein [Nocardioidaceae bacterium]